MTDKSSKLREIPSVDLVLQELGGLVSQYGHEQVSDAIRTELEQLRKKITTGNDGINVTNIEHIASSVSEELRRLDQRSFIPVFNLTGTVLHTNLGRALLPQNAIDAVIKVSRSASNLEYDLQQGKRGDRDVHIENLICELTGAEAATVVNNNAAAVLLTLNTLGKNKEVPVSRGELVEIGGSFRMPEIISSSGCKLIEVGTTNRTHLKDFANALTSETAMLLKVHPRNYRIEGFVKEVKETDLAD